LTEQNDEWAVTRRYMTLETLDGLSDDAAKPRGIAAACSALANRTPEEFRAQHIAVAASAGNGQNFNLVLYP
jgi:hypothetical protein